MKLLPVLVLTLALFSASAGFCDGEETLSYNPFFDISASTQIGILSGDFPSFLAYALRPTPWLFQNTGIGVKAAFQVLPNNGLECSISILSLSANFTRVSPLTIGTLGILKVNWFNRFPFGDRVIRFFLKPYFGINYAAFAMASDTIDLFKGYYSYFENYGNSSASGPGAQMGLEFGFTVGNHFYVGVAAEACLTEVAWLGNPKRYFFWNWLLPITVGMKF